MIIQLLIGVTRPMAIASHTAHPPRSWRKDHVVESLLFNDLAQRQRDPFRALEFELDELNPHLGPDRTDSLLHEALNLLSRKAQAVGQLLDVHQPEVLTAT